MYDRASRSFHQVTGCTLDHVGPGTYDHQRKRVHDGKNNPISIVLLRQEPPFFSRRLRPFSLAGESRTNILER